MKKNIDKETALARLQSQCSVKEICTNEAKQKLYRWGISSEESSYIIDLLKEQRFINDLRYAKAFVNDKFYLSKWGAIKIKSALHVKGINGNIITEVLKDIDKDEQEIALFDIITKKYNSLKDKTSKESFAKLMRFGASRGYSYDSVYRACSKITKEEYLD